MPCAAAGVAQAAMPAASAVTKHKQFMKILPEVIVLIMSGVEARS